VPAGGRRARRGAGMSMNLAFENNDYEVIDFPFQTPTELSLKVMDSSYSERVYLITEYILRYMYEDDDFESKTKLIDKCVGMLSDDKLELILV
jgi:hypothetical protein